MIEVEQKFRIADKRSLKKALLKAGYKVSPMVRQTDRIFLLKSDSFKTFKLGDPVMRIRTVNNSKTYLTYKRDVGSSGDRLEHEISVSPAATVETLLLEMGYKLVVEVKKERTEYNRDAVSVVLDQVKRLGSFAEVEIVCEEGGETEARLKVMAVAADLGLRTGDIETKKYDQLISLSAYCPSSKHLP